MIAIKLCRNLTVLAREYSPESTAPSEGDGDRVHLDPFPFWSTGARSMALD